MSDFRNIAAKQDLYGIEDKPGCALMASPWDSQSAMKS